MSRFIRSVKNQFIIPGIKLPSIQGMLVVSDKFLNITSYIIIFMRSEQDRIVGIPGYLFWTVYSPTGRSILGNWWNEDGDHRRNTKMPTYKFSSNLGNEEIRRRLREATGDDVRLYDGEDGDRTIRMNAAQADRFNRLPVNMRHAAVGGRVRQQLNG